MFKEHASRVRTAGCDAIIEGAGRNENHQNLTRIFKALGNFVYFLNMNKYNPNNIHLAKFTGRSENARKS